MNVYLAWFLAAAGGLLAVAVFVAWWEHLQRQEEWCDAPPTPTPPPAQSVDVSLDQLALAEAAPGATETGTRRAVFDHAVSRMSAPAWLDTQPRVAQGLADVPAASEEPTPSAHG